MGDVSEEIDGAFDVLDDLDGDDQVEGCGADGGREMRVVEILHEELLVSSISGRVAVDGENIETERAEALAHGAGTGAEVESASASGQSICDDAEDEIVQAGWCGGSDHFSALARGNAEAFGSALEVNVLLDYHSVYL